LKKLLLLLLISLSFISSVASANARLFDFGVTYDLDGGMITGSDGLRCFGKVILTKSSNLTCNNRATYRQCKWAEDEGINKDCGTDGTSYWIEDNCIKSSFGSSCCGSVNFYASGHNGDLTCNIPGGANVITYSDNNISIPPNAMPYDGSWKCKIGYIIVGNKCLKAIEHGKYDENSSLVICDTGYRWIWNQSTGGLCKRDESLIYDSPSNSILAGSSWKCNSGYYKYGFSCLILPLNSKANQFDGFTCSSNYTKIGNGCILIEKAKDKLKKTISKKIETKLTEKTYEVEFWNSIKDSDDSQEYQIYLEEYPEGKFVKLAQLRIKKLGTILISDDQTFIPKLDYGNYHALVIGNDQYKHLNPLSNAVNDAKDVATLLKSKYQFNVNVLTNATRDEIVSALSKLRNTVSASDNILVYYAGHGIRDEAVDEGYWLPVDAQDNDQVHWISNETIMRSVKGMNAKHVMIVADSCFSGTLTRGVTIADKSPGYIIKMVNQKARTVLTSGGLEPVSDSGGGGNSIFASSFLRILDENKGVLEGNQLFTKIRKQVRQNSDQTPEYGLIRKAGHDGGDFLFVRH